MVNLEQLDERIAELQDELRGLQGKVISVGRLDGLVAESKNKQAELAGLLSQRVKLTKEVS